MRSKFHFFEKFAMKVTQLVFVLHVLLSVSFCSNLEAVLLS